MILYISLANACQSIPENYYKFLNLDETISLSNYIVVVEKVKDGPSIGLFPSGEEIGWMEIYVKDIISNKSDNLVSNVRIQAPLPCGYAGGYSYLEKGIEYLMFIGEKDEEGIFHPIINVKNTSSIFYGLTAYKIENNQIMGLNLSLDDLKEKLGYSKNNVKTKISVWQKILNWFNRLFSHGSLEINEQNLSLERIKTLCKTPDGISPKQVFKCLYKKEFYLTISADCLDCGNSFYNSKLESVKSCPGFDIYRDIDDICYKATNCTKVIDC